MEFEFLEQVFKYKTLKWDFSEFFDRDVDAESYEYNFKKIELYTDGYIVWFMGFGLHFKIIDGEFYRSDIKYLPELNRLYLIYKRKKKLELLDS